MNYATIIKHSETNYQVVVLFKNMTGPIWLSSFPTRYKARKYINELTNNIRKLVSLDKLFDEHERRVHMAYLKSRIKDNGK